MEETKTEVDIIFENDKALSKVISRALHKAIQTFYKEIEKAGYDGAYFGLQIKIVEYSSDFDSIMETLTWDNLIETKKEEKIRRYV